MDHEQESQHGQVAGLVPPPRPHPAVGAGGRDGQVLDREVQEAHVQEAVGQWGRQGQIPHGCPLGCSHGLCSSHDSIVIGSACSPLGAPTL